ncbi:MAG: IS630 family transposase [Thermacetogeniaceae bacterium]
MTTGAIFVGRVSQRAHMILLSNRRFCVLKISKIFGTREATVRRWIERFEQGGIDSLCDRPRPGRPPKVAAGMLPVIERDVLSTPASHGYLFTIWTTINISVHLAFKYGIEISQTTCRRILRVLDFRHNRPRHGPKKARDPLAKEKLKAILGVLSSKVSGNHVLYEDECDIHLMPPLRAMWMKKAKQVRIPTPGTNSKKSIFGALDIRTGKWIYQIFDLKRKEQFIESLDHIITLYPTGRIHIILDNYSTHKARLVKEWLTNHPRVKLYYLSCYTPQLNPVEKIWWRLKGVVAANRLYGTLGALMDAVEAFFKELTESEALTLAA